MKGRLRKFLKKKRQKRPVTIAQQNFRKTVVSDITVDAEITKNSPITEKKSNTSVISQDLEQSRQTLNTNQEISSDVTDHAKKTNPEKSVEINNTFNPRSKDESAQNDKSSIQQLPPERKILAPTIISNPLQQITSIQDNLTRSKLIFQRIKIYLFLFTFLFFILIIGLIAYLTTKGRTLNHILIPNNIDNSSEAELVSS